MKAILIVFLILIGLLQYRLWLGNGGLVEVWRMHHAVEEQKQENATLLERNKSLQAEVNDLKQGLDAIEERARSELGMVKKDETFFQTIEKK